MPTDCSAFHAPFIFYPPPPLLIVNLWNIFFRFRLCNRKSIHDVLPSIISPKKSANKSAICTSFTDIQIRQLCNSNFPIPYCAACIFQHRHAFAPNLPQQYLAVKIRQPNTGGKQKTAYGIYKLHNNLG